MPKDTEERLEKIVESDKIKTKTRAEIELDESIEQNVLFCMWYSGLSK